MPYNTSLNRTLVPSAAYHMRYAALSVGSEPKLRVFLR